MSELDTIRKLAYNWGSEEGQKVKDCPLEARVITGLMIADGQFYYFEQASGIRLEVSKDFNSIVGYEILDEQKFVWFALRWS